MYVKLKPVKPQALDHSEYPVSNLFFYCGYSMTLKCDGFLYEVICSRHATASLYYM